MEDVSTDVLFGATVIEPVTEISPHPPVKVMV